MSDFQLTNEKTEKNMTEQAKESRGYLFTAILIIAIVLIAWCLLPPHFIRYSGHSWCDSARRDAGNIMASLSCYFSEPENLSCKSIENLLNDETCGFTLDNKDAELKQIGELNDAWWIITVTDNTGRCEKGRYFRTYMGTNGNNGEWH